MTNTANKQFIRLCKSQGGIFQYRCVLAGGKLGPKLWAVDYKDARGKKARKMGLETRFAAVEFVNENTVAASGPALAPEKMTFTEATKTYRTDRERNGKRADSYGHLKRFNPMFGGLLLGKISSAQIEEALERLTKEREWSVATRNHALNQLSGLFSFAMRRRWLRDHPIRFGRVETYAENNRRDRWLRPHEIQALVAKARVMGRECIADAIEFAAVTGKRLGEIQRLRRADFTTDGAGNPALWIGKTKNGTPELLPIAGVALALVKRLATASDSPSAYLFQGPRGRSVRRIIDRDLHLVVEAVAAEHPDWKLEYGRGKNQVTFHTLRASFATIGNAAGMSERDLMTAGNWRSRAMLDRYVRRDDETLRAGLGRVGEVVFGKFAAAPEEPAETA
jgi:integrase